MARRFSSKRPTGDPAEVEKFMRRVVVQKDGCWFLGVNIHRFDGHSMFNGMNAHRWSYLLFRGEIPEGRIIDHLCGHQPCVNPNHLEHTHEGENLRRARESLKAEGYASFNERWLHRYQIRKSEMAGRENARQ